MAVRLSVIMVHTSPPTAAAQRLSEAVVGELIGLGGVDLTLVGPLAHLSDSSTDRLSLGSLEGDVAVLDWNAPSKIIHALNSIGFIGRRTPHARDREQGLDDNPGADDAVGQNLRRVYCYDLHSFEQPREVIAALKELRESRQVKTVSLGVLRGPASTRNRVAPAPVPDGGPGDGRSSTDREKVETTDRASGTESSNSGPVDSEPRQPGRLNLDALVDQLDAFDP